MVSATGSAKQPFYKGVVVWGEDTKEVFDVVIWCTSFRVKIDHLKLLNKVQTVHTRSIVEPSLWLVGYGNWTGFASATIYGVGITARRTVEDIFETLNQL